MGGILAFNLKEKEVEPMGAGIPSPRRCFAFSMRNPFARALALATTLFTLCMLLLQSQSSDVRGAILRTANTAKGAIASQRPLGNHKHGAWGDGARTPSEVTGGHSVIPVSANSNLSHPMTCDYDMERLKEWQEKFKLQGKFEYTKRYVQISRESGTRKSITELDEDFMPDQVTMVDVKKKYQTEKCPQPLRVPVTQSPFPATANASDFIFGVSTTYKRFMDPRTSPINEWSYWLTDSKGHSNGGKLVLMLLGASVQELEDAYGRLRNVGIDVDVYQSDTKMEMAVRYLTLVPTLYNHPKRKDKKWIVICDDDTFFPSFHALAEKFEGYNHERPMYIGTFSEDANNIARHGEQAFGGAGVFLSVPMAKIVTDKYEACKTDEKIKESNTGWGPQGDILLRKCIYENSETRLTMVQDLWQLDLFGDPSGFYESGIKPLSLHHYRGGSWHKALPWHYTKVSHICGEDCMMQRFQTADNFIISNGFSIAYYPKGIDFDLDQFERTFRSAPDDKGWNLDFKFGPQRPSLLRTGRKVSWDLQEANLNEDGTLTQIYVRKHDDHRWKNPDGSAMSSTDGLIELIWLPDEKQR